MSDSDFSLRLPVPVMARPRRPLSISASTASWSIRFSLRTMISGAPSSSSLFRRLLRLITLLQRLELALDALALGLGRGLDRSLERLLVGVEALLGALLRGLGVGLELLDLLLNLGQHALRHIARHQIALVDHRLFIAVEPDSHGPARLGADPGLDVLRGL